MFYYCRQFIAIFTVALMGIHLMSSAKAETKDNYLPRSIHVSGTGKVSVVPDMADLVLSVEVQAKTAEDARNQAAVTMEALIKALKDAGVPSKDIQTRSVSLYPNYSADTANKLISYQLSNQVAIGIHDIQKASDIIDTAVKAGGNSTRVQDIGFTLENPESALAQARDLAYANAKKKAEQYAKLAAATLGSPLHISEGSDISTVPMPFSENRMMRTAIADRADTPVQVGEQVIAVTVDVMFGIQ